MIVLDDNALEVVLDWNTLISAMRQAHCGYVDLSERMLLSERSGDAGGIEPVPDVAGMAVRSLSRHQAGHDLSRQCAGARAADQCDGLRPVYGRDGRPLAAIEGAQLTLRKTAANRRWQRTTSPAPTRRRC